MTCVSHPRMGAALNVMGSPRRARDLSWLPRSTRVIATFELAKPFAHSGKVGGFIPSPNDGQDTARR